MLNVAFRKTCVVALWLVASASAWTAEIVAARGIAGDWKHYDRSVGFDIDAEDNFCDFCYSDQFATGFRFEKGGGGIFDKCFCFWYKSGRGMKHVAFESIGTFRAHVNDPTVRFRDPEGRNALLKVGEPGGDGFIRNPCCDFKVVNDSKSVFEPYVQTKNRR